MQPSAVVALQWRLVGGFCNGVQVFVGGQWRWRAAFSWVANGVCVQWRLVGGFCNGAQPLVSGQWRWRATFSWVVYGGGVQPLGGFNGGLQFKRCLFLLYLGYNISCFFLTSLAQTSAVVGLQWRLVGGFSNGAQLLVGGQWW